VSADLVYRGFAVYYSALMKHLVRYRVDTSRLRPIEAVAYILRCLDLG